MPSKNYNDNPTISDLVVFDLQMTDSDGDDVNPYKVNNVTIYFIERGFTAENVREYVKEIGEVTSTEYFKQAVPVAVFGDSDNPAWIASDPDGSFLTHVEYDDDGDPLTGVFRLEWLPRFPKEGDYLLCYTWTVVAAGDVSYGSIQFYLYGDTKQTTSIPSHFTPEDKYETLLERYLPEMYKVTLTDNDLTPDVIDKFNRSVAKAFTTVEDLANQIVDQMDSNAVSDTLLPYLGSLFGTKLRSDDTVLWRKQIKRAVPLFKKKGTLSGLQEALANADVTFIGLTKMWQVVSKSTWQEGFVISEAIEETFTLEKTPILPIDSNYELYIRLEGEDDYTELTFDYVSFSGNTMTWLGENLSFNPISLHEGDVIRVIYKFAEPEDQSIEDYIRTLPLADNRDEVDVTYPLKNWNVRLIAEDDSMFDSVIPSRHPFQYPVVFGRVRTEFPYSENAWNTEEYNGSTRESTDPCDIDKEFVDVCSDCQSSKFIIEVEIEDMSSERIQEVEDIIKDYVPFHARIHSINYSASKHEYYPSPIEDIRVLVNFSLEDMVTSSQFDFNRILEDARTNAGELKRNMLASTTSSAGSGTGTNLAIVLFSPGIRFGSLGIISNNYLEILSGPDAGEYKVTPQGEVADIVQGVPDTIAFPINTSEFSFRLSNVLYSDTVSIYQDDRTYFSDANVDFIDYGVDSTWKVAVTSGAYVGTYEINTVNPDGTLTIAGFPTTSTQTGVSYELRTSSNVSRFSGTTGRVTTQRVGRVETDLIAEEYGVTHNDYVHYGSTQYKIIDIAKRTGSPTVDKLYIDGYTGGDVVGVASVKVYHRLIQASGYLDVRGMKLVGTVPTVSYVTENNTFRENYLILIGTNYYQISSISGSEMLLNGPKLQWGLTGTAVSYSIIKFTKTAQVTANDHVFDFLDRRGNESYTIEVSTGSSMGAVAAAFNAGGPVDSISGQENIWFNIENR